MCHKAYFVPYKVAADDWKPLRLFTAAVSVVVVPSLLSRLPWERRVEEEEEEEEPGLSLS